MPEWEGKVGGGLAAAGLISGEEQAIRNAAILPLWGRSKSSGGRQASHGGKEVRNLVTVILLCFAASLHRSSAVEHPIFNKALICVHSIVDFTLMSQFKSHTDETIQYVKQYLKAFHNHKDVFKEYRKDKSTTSAKIYPASEARAPRPDASDVVFPSPASRAS